MNQVVWFRQDLRIHDHIALSEAAARGPVIALYVLSPAQWKQHGDAPAKVDFWLRSLSSLSESLLSLNIPLKILHLDTYAQVPDAIVSSCREWKVTTLHCHREQGVNERRRDRATYQALAQHGIDMVGYDGNTLLTPGSVKTGADAYYRVFTPFSRACRAVLRGAPLRLRAAPSAQKLAAGLPSSDPVPACLPDWPQMGSEMVRRWPATESAAASRLQSFCDRAIDKYDQQRDVPSVDGTSMLSPYLAAGLLSPSQCLHAAMVANRGELDTGHQGGITWINELLWREFYMHLMHGFPHLSMHQPMRPETAAVQWRDDASGFQAWCEGRTGVPIVDAAMRQLLATGWMHNRLRMVVAMFLTKNLLIDWRQGEAFFMRHLIDGELCANNGGWQWSASTGADAAPYFRVFNPVSQSEKFDPEGVFIKHWVPELAGVSPRDIHDPDAQLRRKLGYPDMIVDLKSSRLRAIEAFKRISA